MRRFYMLGLVLAATAWYPKSHSQAATPATPQHPIDTRPEGPGKTCSYSGSRTGNQTTGSSTCTPPDAGGITAAKRFPYPGELSDAAPGNAAPNAAADAPQASGSGQAAGKRFPYPGETGPLKDAGSSGESTNSSSSSSDSALPPDEGSSSADTLPAPKRARKKLPAVPRQTPDEREQEDVRIAGFYQNDGNYRAAYMRAKDAVGLADDDPEAQYALAEAARKLGKFDEAQKGYKRCLELDPVPKLRKGSEKALKEMAGS